MNWGTQISVDSISKNPFRISETTYDYLRDLTVLFLLISLMRLNRNENVTTV